MRTQINFEETDYYSITCLRDQNDERHRYGSLAFENQRKLSGMFLDGRPGPQGCEEGQQLVVIRQLSGSDTNIRHRSPS